MREPEARRAVLVVRRRAADPARADAWCCATAGFEVVPAQTPREALDRAAVRPPQAAIVDLVLPDGDGIEVTRRLREWSEMPILVLSAVGEEEQKVRALEAGADDYVTKPFGARELVARLQAALRRAAPDARSRASRRTGLEIDLAARAVRRDGEEVHLTPIEFDLLRVLARNRGRLMTHRALLVEVWGPEYADDVQPLRTHIASLRAQDRAGRGRRRRATSSPTRVGYRFAASQRGAVTAVADASRAYRTQSLSCGGGPYEIVMRGS